MTELWERDAWDLADSVRFGDVTAMQLLDEFLPRIEKLDPELNAFCFMDLDSARARAEAVDAAVARGEDPGLFAGVPMGVKELAQVEGWPDTHASKAFEHDIAPHDDTETARLRAAGANFVGLTTSPEFGIVNWTDTILHGTTRNPWNTERTPGGSSGGSAAAVASGMMPICTGSDGGGSIRIPSAYSGLFGFKVSFGRVGYKSNFDNALMSVRGPICRSVRDAARYIDVIAGPTNGDPTSLPKPTVSYEAGVVSGDSMEDLRGLRAAWSSTLGGIAVCDPEVEKLAYEAVLALCAEAGIELVDIDVRFPKYSRAYSIISQIGDATDFGERIDVTPPEDLTQFVLPGYETMRAIGSDGIVTALRRRNELLDAIGAIFDQVDLFFTPTIAVPAFKAEGLPPMEIAGQPVNAMGSVPYCAPFNISGMPAASIPVGLSSDGLPIGLQVIARRSEEERVFGAGAIAEANRPWQKFAPMAYTA